MQSSPPKTRQAWLGLTLAASIAVVVTTEWLTPRSHSLPALTPFTLNVAGFAALVALVVALTNRTLFSIALVAAVYETLVFSNRLKIDYLATPIHPADLLAASNLVYVHLFSQRVLVIGGVAALAIIVALAALFRVRSFPATGVERAVAVAVGLTVLLGLANVERSPSALAFLQARGVASYTPDPSIEVEYNGVLLNLFLHVSDLMVPVPKGYDAAAVRRVLSMLSDDPAPGGAPRRAQPVNLVLFVVEAMMDPTDLGWRFTSDPMPFLHSLRKRFSSGWAYSPELGGKSANPEFELLSGLATYYLPRESMPYMTFISRPLPALPRFFSERGYHVSALHVDTLGFFNYVEVYRDFGFSDARTIRSKPGVPLDAAGRVPSDDALVDFVIEVSRESSPYFLFGFTNSTHLPYDYPAYLGSDLDIVDPLPKPIHDEVKTYVNALRTTDRAIEKLVHSFERSSDPVVVAILGDHLPGLSAEAMARSEVAKAKRFVDGVALSHRCPIVLWSNFGADKSDFEVSFNFVGQRILAEMSIEPTGVWRANAAMAARYPVISKFVQRRDGTRFLPGELPAVDAKDIADYGFIEYDLLFGKQYALHDRPPA